MVNFSSVPGEIMEAWHPEERIPWRSRRSGRSCWLWGLCWSTPFVKNYTWSTIVCEKKKLTDSIPGEGHLSIHRHVEAAENKALWTDHSSHSLFLCASHGGRKLNNQECRYELQFGKKGGEMGKGFLFFILSHQTVLFLIDNKFYNFHQVKSVFAYNDNW